MPEHFKTLRETYARHLDAFTASAVSQILPTPNQSEKATLRDKRNAVTQDDIDRAFEDVFKTFIVPTDHRLAQEAFCAMDDYVVKVRSRFSFVTSDHPMAHGSFLPVGQPRLLLPLSPDQLLVGIYHPQLLQRILSFSDDKLVAALNADTVGCAETVCVTATETMGRYIQNRFSKQRHLSLANRLVADLENDLPRALKNPA